MIPSETTTLLEAMPDVAAVATHPPFTPSPEEHPIFEEVQAIEGLLIKATRTRYRERSVERRRSALALLAAVGLGAFLWSFFRPIFLDLMTIFVVLVASVILFLLFRDWLRRDVDALVNLREVTDREQKLIQGLLSFSRAALLGVT